MLPLRLLAACLAVCVGALPMLPATHVHETEEHGHHERLAHSHRAAHRHGGASAHSHATSPHHHEHDTPAGTFSPGLKPRPTPALPQPAPDSPGLKPRPTPADDHGEDDEDTVVVTLDPLLGPLHATLHFAPPLTAVLEMAEPVLARPLVAAIYVERLIHGPPRAPSELRGPPFSSRL